MAQGVSAVRTFAASIDSRSRRRPPAHPIMPTSAHVKDVGVLRSARHEIIKHLSREMPGRGAIEQLAVTGLILYFRRYFCGEVRARVQSSHLRRPPTISLCACCEIWCNRCLRYSSGIQSQGTILSPPRMRASNAASLASIQPCWSVLVSAAAGTCSSCSLRWYIILGASELYHTSDRALRLISECA